MHQQASPARSNQSKLLDGNALDRSERVVSCIEIQNRTLDGVDVRGGLGVFAVVMEDGRK